MVDATTERFLYLWLLREVAFLLVLFALLSASVLGDSAFASDVGRPLRVAALAFVAVELLIPVWVVLDLRRREDDPDRMWVHATAMPLVDLFGLLGYLEDRRHSREGSNTRHRRPE